MKKLVAIAVVLASLTAAVFAQEEEESKWKVGFMAEFVTDMLVATDMSGKSESTVGGTTTTQEFGKFNKGTFNFFPNQGKPDYLTNFDNRLSVSLSRSGENYDVYADIALDNWAKAFASGMSVGEFLLTGTPETDWYAKGTAGIFNAQVGTASYGGFVSPQSTWNNWYGWNAICKFGVWRTPDDFYVGNDFRTHKEWGAVAALGATFADNYRVSLGYRFNPNWVVWEQSADPAASKSSINGSFMANARISDAIAVDLFYSVIGEDPNTFSRPTDTIGTAAGITLPDGSWNNILGAYVGLNMVQNLGLSLGYTANFAVYEKGGYLPAGETDPTKSKPVSFTAPVYSGIDLRANYSGIDKVGLTFNNNISFAGVKGKKIEAETEKYVLGFGNSPLGENISQSWFHLESELKASLALVDKLDLVVQLGDRLSVTSSEDTTSGTFKRKDTKNEFRFTVGATYGVGAVSIGSGLFFGVKTLAYEAEASGGDSQKASSNVATFGIPVYFKVAY